MKRCSRKPLQLQGTVEGDLSITSSLEKAEWAVDPTEVGLKGIQRFSQTSKECSLAMQKSALANSHRLPARAQSHQHWTNPTTESVRVMSRCVPCIR